MNMELFEQAAKIQAPTTQAIATIAPVITGVSDAISKTADDTKRELEQVRKAIEASPAGEVPKPLNILSSEKLYNLIKTNVNVKTVAGDLPAWKFNSRSQNQGRIKVFEKGGQEYVWNIPEMANAITLTAGLKELLFNDAADEHIINLADIKNWMELITTSGLGHTYKRSDIFKNKIRIIQNRLETMGTLQPKVGVGLKALTLTPSKTVIIPSDPDRLRSELVLQLAAIKAGKNNL